MSQILASPVSGWLNISASGASFSGARDLSALVAVEFLPAGGQQVYYNFEHNHDGVYSGVSHNHNGVYSGVSHNHNGVYSPVEHTHSGLLKGYSLRYIGDNVAFVFNYGVLGWSSILYLLIARDFIPEFAYHWLPHHGSTFVDNSNDTMYSNKISNSGGVFTITWGGTLAVKNQSHSSSYTYDLVVFGY